jgi:hypothetical protein
VNLSSRETAGAIGITGVNSSSMTACNFIGCSAAFEGGVLVAESSLLCLSRSHFLNNSAGGRGAHSTDGLAPNSVHQAHRAGRAGRSTGGGGAIVFRSESPSAGAALLDTDSIDSLFTTEGCCFTGNRVEPDAGTTVTTGLGLDVLIDGATYESYDDRFLNLEGSSVTIRQGTFNLYHSRFYGEAASFLTAGHPCMSGELQRAYEAFVAPADNAESYSFSSVSPTVGSGVPVSDVSVADGPPPRTRVPAATPLGRTVVTGPNSFTKISPSFVSPPTPATPTGSFTGSIEFTATGGLTASARITATDARPPSAPIRASDVFLPSATFTPLASPSRSPIASPSQSKLPAAVQLSMSVSEIETVMSSMSLSISEIESISITFVMSVLISESEVVYESEVLLTQESYVQVVVVGSDSQLTVSESVVILSMLSVSRSVQVVTVTTRTMVSSVLVSLTFVRVEMPVYVTVISQIVLAVERPTTVVATQVSNATLIGGVSGGLVLVLALMAFGIWFRKQGNNAKDIQVEMDFDYLDDDIVRRTSKTMTMEGGQESPRTRKVQRVKVQENIQALQEEEDEYSEYDSPEAGDEVHTYGFQVPKEFWPGGGGTSPAKGQRKSAAQGSPARGRQTGTRTIRVVQAPASSDGLWT